MNNFETNKKQDDSNKDTSQDKNNVSVKMGTTQEGYLACARNISSYGYPVLEIYLPETGVSTKNLYTKEKNKE